MTEIIISKKDAQGRINNVTFCYVKLQSGSYKYQSKTELEYTVDVVVSREVAKEYKKLFPKNSCKEIETSEFKDKFKIDPPYPDKDEQFIIKLKSNANITVDVPSAELSKGDLIPYTWSSRPKAFEPCEGGVTDITMVKLIANGSKGDVIFTIRENSFGRFSQLKSILVTDLIEYIQEGSGSDFGNVVGGYNPGNGNPQQTPTENEEPANAQGEVLSDPFPDDDMDQIPF